MHQPITTFPSRTAPERLADGVVHAISLVGFVVAGFFLLRLAVASGQTALLAATIVYTFAVLFSIIISFAYHLLPRHDWRATMRRWDHAAIYVVIAGTFTPLLITAGTWSAHTILAVIWFFAALGVWFKLFAANIESRWSLISYLGLGWFALIALPDFLTQLPIFSTLAVAAGGLFYTIGTLFYRNKDMRFRYPIWHIFGTFGGFSFFAGIWSAVSSAAA